jgi:hypothetical protein
VVGCLSLVITCRNAGTQVSSNIHKDVRETVSRNRVSHVSAIGEGDAALAAGGGHNHHITGVAPHPHHPSQITLETPPPAHHQQRRTIAPGAPPCVLKRSPPLRRHPPRSPQPARLPHSSSRPLRSARSRRGQSFRRLAHSPTAPTAPPPRRPAWPATRKTRPNHAPAPPPSGTPRGTVPAHPQRRSPGCTLPERLSAPPAAQAVHRHVFCPAPPRKPPDARCGASQRGPAPARSSPASRLPPATPSAPVGSCCSLRQAPAKRPCAAQPTPQAAAVRSS